MKACIFVGPTLPLAEARGVLEAHYLPPIRLGDLYEAVSLLRPRAVGIIDGHFQWSPPVWHKEILWALQQGVQVFGAASMGALRAAELQPFGMRGVGRVFEAYRDGVLADDGDHPFEDDDEVAVMHGPAELGYPAVSEAMVNIRLTLAKAVREGVLAEATGIDLRRIAKSLFFPERSYSALLGAARLQRLANDDLRAFEQWLPTGRIDQKRADALAMLQAMRASTRTRPPPAPPAFVFEPTCYWQTAIARLDRGPTLGEDAALALAELRLDVPAWRSTRQQAFDRLVGPEPAQTPSSEPAAQLAAAHSRRSRLALLEQLPPAIVERLMVEALQTGGRFDGLRARGEAKRRCLTGVPTAPAVDTLGERQKLELTDWFFTTLVGEEMPDDLDAWIEDTGYPDEPSFHAALFDEFRFRQASLQTSSPQRHRPGSRA